MLLLDYSSSGFVMVTGDINRSSVLPTVYLKSTVAITSGDGSSNDPYQLGI